MAMNGHPHREEQERDNERSVPQALKDRFARPRIQPRDDWGRLLLAASCDCGVSLSNEAVSSEGL